MALTIGAAPLTHPPGGTYNFDFDQLAPDHILYLEDVPKRIRGVLANETILDTRRGKMLHETGEFIQWYIPLEDVRSEVLKPSNRRTSNPYKGDTTFYNVRVGEHVETNAAWSHERAPQASPPLRDLVAFDFARLDAWFEEDDQIFGHSRDPYHRFDCLAYVGTCRSACGRQGDCRHTPRDQAFRNEHAVTLLYSSRACET